MQIITLYRYARPDGGITNSPIKPDCEYTLRYRLVADEGKMLTNGTDATGCVDTANPDEWTEVDDIPEWVQPDSTNPYRKGDKVVHNGKTWESTIDNNVWEPGVYGWAEAN